MLPAVLEYYRANQQLFLEGLMRLLRVPSVSTLPEHKPDVRRAAELLAGELEMMGMTRTELIEGRAGEHPLVYSEWLGAPGKPTLLLYGHYDVQPPDPLGEWTSSPFEPAVRGENLFARGASDDKGQTYMLLKAVEGFLKTGRRLPVNVKFLVEGEEEVGGPHIERFVPAERDKLRCDAAVICDTAMFAPELPTLVTALRGLVYVEVEARGAAHDLHSGMYGGAAPNPMQALAEIISGLKGRDGRIRIPGFYKRVGKPTSKQRAAWKRLPFSERNFLREEVGSAALAGERGYPVLERLWVRPTLEVHGIKGGFTGDGAKTVIPAVATAKISMRLVPAMSPKEVIAQFTRSVKNLTPRGIQTAVRVISQAPPAVVSTDSPYVMAAAEAMGEVFKRKAVYVGCGGSIPIAGLLTYHLKVPVVLMGFGLPDDNLHAPDEKLYLPNFYRGIEAVGRYLSAVGSR
jgi:acetylornithine deacetylase/succinyl-diaminopimelate desuccinylase-like protein